MDAAKDFIRRCFSLLENEDVFGYSLSGSENNGDAKLLSTNRILLGTDDGQVIITATMAPKEVFDYWGEDQEFPRRDWQYQVGNGDTNQGYWEWVEHEREITEDEKGRE